MVKVGSTVDEVSGRVGGSHTNLSQLSENIESSETFIRNYLTYPIRTIK